MQTVQKSTAVVSKVNAVFLCTALASWQGCGVEDAHEAPEIEGQHASLVASTSTATLQEARASAAVSKLIAEPGDLQIARARPELSDVIRIDTSILRRLALCPPPPGTRPDPTLVNVDPFVLARFPLDRVFNQLVALSPAAAPTPLQLYRQLWDSLGTGPGLFPAAPHCNDSAPPNINGFPIECPRPEAGLRTTTPAVFRPVALFNRFDLAPSDGSHCGEYRIVYAAQGTGGREFVIFEGILPNPRPSCGLEACRPVAKFWDSLASFDPTTAAGQTGLADALDAFYFKGLTGFEPVVHPDHYGALGSGGYGSGKGQIRLNLFGGSQWQLRDYLLRSPCPGGVCPLVMQPATVKNNPFFDLFDVTSSEPRAPGFQASFPSTVPALAAGTINQISMSISDKFNAGQSNSSAFFERYENPLGGPNAFTAAIDAANPNPALTAENIAARATTQSCGGCHQNSNFANLGAGLVWPPSLGFVHVDEASNLSEALWCTFLPARKQVLNGFLSSPPLICPRVLINPQILIKPTLVLDPLVPLSSVPAVAPSELTVSGKLLGPN